MKFVAKANRIPISPYKLRPIVDVVRGKDVVHALNWLGTYQVKRVVPIRKMIESGIANANSLQGIQPNELKIKEIKVDQGRIHRYFKPGSMGRAAAQSKRDSHMSVVLEQITTSNKEEV